jgi:acetyltransferase-like isoleucine patch superfamily enzyme
VIPQSESGEEIVVSKMAVLETDTLGSGTSIGDFAVVRANVQLGDNVVVHPHVVIEPGVVVGDGVEIFPGAYIGKKTKGAGALARTPEFEEKVEIGANCCIGTNAVIYYDVSIGKNTLIGDGASIREQCVIGEECVVGTHVTVGYTVRIGDRVKLMDHTHVVGKSLIESDAFVAMNVGMAHNPYHGVYKPEYINGITIRSRAIVSVGANLLPGVEIGEGAVVAGGAVVSRDVPARKLVMGVPARVVRDVK